MSEEEIIIQKIETGDSLKVKQVLDEATIDAVKEEGYSLNYSYDNFKLGIMFVSCLFALIAQFTPIPFPDNRILLGVCCVCYFILCGVFQFMVMFIEKDRLLVTLPLNNDPSTSFVLHAKFPKYQEYYTVVINENEKVPTHKTTGIFYVGKYFTEAGEFDQIGFVKDIKQLVNHYQQKKYTEFKFDYKSKSKSD